MTGQSHEDNCYACGLGGELIECDECPKVYHKVCIDAENVLNEDVFICQWHLCNICKSNNYEFTDQESVLCVGCPTSYCEGCAPENVMERVAMISQEDGTSENPVVNKLLREHYSCSAGRWTAGMLPPNSKVFVCEKCEAREIMDSDEYVEKSLYEGFENPRLKELLSTARGEDRVSKAGGESTFYSKSGGVRESKEPKLEEEMFTRYIEAFMYGENGEIQVCRKWSSSLEACKELEFDANLIEVSLKSFQDYRKQLSETVVCACSLMWCYVESQASAPDFTASYFYPEIEVRDPRNQSDVLFTFANVHEVVRLLTVDQMDIYNAAKGHQEFLEGKRSASPKLYSCHFRFTEENVDSQQEQPKWKKKKFRDFTFLERLKVIAREHKNESQSQSSIVSKGKLRVDSTTSSPRRRLDSAAKERRFLNSPNHAADSQDTNGSSSRAHELFGDRKEPMVGYNLYQVSEIPRCAPHPEAAAPDFVAKDSDLEWRPSFEVSDEILQELRLCQYLPGLVVKVADARGVHDVSSWNSNGAVPGNSSCTAVGMVIETPSPGDSSIWLALDNERVERFPIIETQTIVQEDRILSAFMSSGGDLQKAKTKVAALAEERIGDQWTSEQFEFFFKCTAKHRDKMIQLHTAVTGGEAEAYNRIAQFSQETSTNPNRSYNTRNAYTFWVNKRDLISKFYQYHPMTDFHDFDEKALSSAQVLERQTANIVGVHRLAAILQHQESNELLDDLKNKVVAEEDARKIIVNGGSGSGSGSGLVITPMALPTLEDLTDFKDVLASLCHPTKTDSKDSDLGAAIASESKKRERSVSHDSDENITEGGKSKRVKAN